MVQQTSEGSGLTFNISAIYALHRPSEDDSFRHNNVPTNHRMLFHASKARRSIYNIHQRHCFEKLLSFRDLDSELIFVQLSNCFGIVSRGLVLPSVASQSGVVRTDAGMLGSGIYFADRAATSAAYAKPGKRGRMEILWLAGLFWQDHD
jgi:poly [ADP-ribose] polymerase